MLKACVALLEISSQSFLLQQEFCKQGTLAKTWEDISFNQAKLYS